MLARAFLLRASAVAVLVARHTFTTRRPRMARLASAFTIALLAVIAPPTVPTVCPCVCVCARARTRAFMHTCVRTRTCAFYAHVYAHAYAGTGALDTVGPEEAGQTSSPPNTPIHSEIGLIR